MDIFLLTLTILITNFLSAVTGFGGTILAMPIIASIVGIQIAKPILMVTAFVQPLCITIAQRQFINWNVLKTIVLICGIGMPVGIWLYEYLPTQISLITLGSIMILASSLGFYRLKYTHINITSKPLLYGLLFLGGVVQGALLSGGPLVVIYATLVLKDKMQFRVTLSALWVVLYTISIIQGIYSNLFSLEIISIIGINIPLLILTVGLANLVAKKISQKLFGYIINIILLLGGIVTITNQIL
jgi:hypothetical protein